MCFFSLTYIFFVVIVAGMLTYVAISRNPILNTEAPNCARTNYSSSKNCLKFNEFFAQTILEGTDVQI